MFHSQNFICIIFHASYRLFTHTGNILRFCRHAVHTRDALFCSALLPACSDHRNGIPLALYSMSAPFLRLCITGLYPCLFLV